MSSLSIYPSIGELKCPSENRIATLANSRRLVWSSFGKCPRAAPGSELPLTAALALSSHLGSYVSDGYISPFLGSELPMFGGLSRILPEAPAHLRHEDLQGLCQDPLGETSCLHLVLQWMQDVKGWHARWCPRLLAKLVEMCIYLAWNK
jgi:hypothetical protein